MADYGKDNIFTFQCGWDQSKPANYVERQLAEPGPVDGYEQYDLGIIEINDDGDLRTAAQLDQINTRVRDTRDQYGQGAIVVAFIHGWHNNADWDNENLVSFRRLLQALMKRELEALRRRVIGVYIGWNGEPTNGLANWLGQLPLVGRGLKHMSFQDRYTTAGKIGEGEAMTDALASLTNGCKSGPESTTVPLILVGHSMGAFILQGTFRELLRNKEAPLVPVSNDAGPLSLRTKDGALLAPDLLLSLNSAAESGVAKDIKELATEQQLVKLFDPARWTVPASQLVPYHPPLLISVTSDADHITNWVWRAGQFFQKASTDGHDPSLATHEPFTKSLQTADCVPSPGTKDFLQPWHCLHMDNAGDPTPRFRVDLPDHDRTNGELLTHTAYDLVPKEPETADPFWLFQVPGDVIADHGDIFNFKAASFVLAMIQISGVLASAQGTNWIDNFSPKALT